MPFGRNRSSYNPRLQERIKTFPDRIKEYKFYNKDFEEIDIPDNSFVYCDPPYLITLATYNERSQWTQNDDNRLFKLLDKLPAKTSGNVSVRYAVYCFSFNKIGLFFKSSLSP